MANDHRVSKPAKIIGWILTILPSIVFIGGGLFGLLADPASMSADLERLGWTSQRMRAVVIVEIICGILYLIPMTSVLGAILLTAYLGGAVATHVRVGDGQWFFAVIFGIVIWLGLYLRDTRLRQLVPLRT